MNDKMPIPVGVECEVHTKHTHFRARVIQYERNYPEPGSESEGNLNGLVLVEVTNIGNKWGGKGDRVHVGVVTLRPLSE